MDFIPSYRTRVFVMLSFKNLSCRRERSQLVFRILEMDIANVQYGPLCAHHYSVELPAEMKPESVVPRVSIGIRTILKWLV